jgi:hypothetical protein
MQAHLIRLEQRVRILASRLVLAEQHVRRRTVDGRDWEWRRDYLIAKLDLALFDLYGCEARMPCN